MVKRMLKLVVRLSLFTLILSGGTIAALMIDEGEGLALADLSDVSVQTLTATSDGITVYANIIDDWRPTGVYRSDDNGRTWQVVSAEPGLAFNTLTGHPADQSTLYAGSAGGPIGVTNNVWRSDDGGRTWHNFNLSLPAGPDRMIPAVTAVVADPEQPGVLYIGTDGQGVYRFIEGQTGFELVGGISLPEAHVKSLVAGSNNRLYMLTNGGLFFTAAGKWQRIESLPELPVSLAIAASDPQRLYVGSASAGAYRSNDGGQTWVHIGDGLGLVPGASLRVTAMAVDDQDPDHVVAATAYGLGSQLAPASIFESIDAGESWSKVADIDTLVGQLTINQNSMLAATTNGLLRFGEPTEALSANPLPGLSFVTQLTGSQVLVLVLTISLAGLALVGRPGWVLQRRRRGT